MSNIIRALGLAAALAATLPVAVANASDMWVGFRTLPDLALPFTDYMAENVVEIITTGMTREVGDRPRIIDTAGLRPLFDTSVTRANFEILQIETCRRQGLRFCPVYRPRISATGFLQAGADATSLYTCRHIFHNWLVWASEANGGIPISQISPPMLIISADGRPLYNSASAQVLFNFSLINADPRLNFQYDDRDADITPLQRQNFRLSDVVGLTSSKVFSNREALPLSEGVEPGGVVYVAGFPGRTNFFADGVGDTRGGVLVASSGTLIEKAHGNAGLVSSVLFYYGSSGSPLIDESGALLGAACSSTHLGPGQDVGEVRTSALSLDPAVLGDLWASLSYTEDDLSFYPPYFRTGPTNAGQALD